MRAGKTAELVRAVIDSTSSTLVPIKPRRAQVENVVTSVKAQTSCVNWQKEIVEAERTVFESSQIWLTALKYSLLDQARLAQLPHWH
jgi:hypothetical protein